MDLRHLLGADGDVPVQYLPGPAICGFWGMFEANYGRPDSPKPYPRVTPSRAGSALLPFHCPRCAQVIDFTDDRKKTAYCDRRNPSRVNYWCPHCGCRFYLNEGGKQARDIDVLGAAVSTVERVVREDDGSVRVDKVVQGRRSWTDRLLGRGDYLAGTDILGAW